MSDDRRTTTPGAGGGGTPAGCATSACPECVYWNQDHQIDYNGPDSKFLTSTQISAVTVAFRLEANLAAGNITITSIFKWGTVAAGITDAEKTDTITKFKAKVTGWGNRFNMKITDPICGEKTLPIRFRLLWSPTDTTDTAPYQVNLYRTYPRAAVTGWNIDIGYDSDVTPNSSWVLAHEYGHTFCLPDEYFYAGVTAATVVYKKADGATESVTLEPSPGNIMSADGNTTYLKRFYFFCGNRSARALKVKVWPERCVHRCLAATVLAALLSNAQPNAKLQKGSNMSEIVVNQVRISLDGTQTLPLSVVRRGSPAYDGPRNFFTVTFKNESSKTKILPFDELRRNTITKYRNPDTSAEIVNNRTPPPKHDGSVVHLAPGETKSFQVVFEYPESIAVMKDKAAILQFCVKWESAWLRKSDYASDAYNWNESFELCSQIRVLED